MLQQCIDSLVQKIQFGVVINFEKVGPDPAPLFLDANKDIEIIDCDKGKDWDSSFSTDGQPKAVANSNVIEIHDFDFTNCVACQF